MSSTSHKIALIGNYDSILGFKGLGLDIFGMTDDNCLQITEQVLADQKYAVVLITEDWIAQLEPMLKENESKAWPAIISIPPPQGSQGLAMTNLKKIVEQAVGSDILKD